MGPRDEFGNLFIVGYNVPSQQEIAEAEARRALCSNCKSHHQTWEPCSHKPKEDQVQTSFTVYDATDEQIAQIRSILDGNATSPASEGGKAEKKDKAAKADAIETTGTEATEEVTFTEKQLNKKERAELVSICEGLGILDSETKGKRQPTLVGLILAKQEALAKAGDEGDDDAFEPDDDGSSEWDEDVPPADDEKPKKKGGKDKKGKGKKKK